MIYCKVRCWTGLIWSIFSSRASFAACRDSMHCVLKAWPIECSGSPGCKLFHNMLHPTLKKMSSHSDCGSSKPRALKKHWAFSFGLSRFLPRACRIGSKRCCLTIDKKYSTLISNYWGAKLRLWVSFGATQFVRWLTYSISATPSSSPDDDCSLLVLKLAAMHTWYCAILAMLGITSDIPAGWI